MGEWMLTRLRGVGFVGRIPVRWHDDGFAEHIKGQVCTYAVSEICNASLGIYPL